MKFAICNEMFGDRPFADTFSTIRKLGYTGVEIAPFTLAPQAAPFDARQVPAERIVEVRTQAEDAGLEVVGLHWLLAKTEGFHLTSPDPTVRRHTAEYLRALAELCADLGGKVMVLGSPQQRNLLAGVSYEDGEAYAAEVLHAAIPACATIWRDDRPRAARPGRGEFHAHGRGRHPTWRSSSARPTAAAPRREGDGERRPADRRHHPRQPRLDSSTSTRTIRTCSARAWATSISGRSSRR